jgi:hypothetical protein
MPPRRNVNLELLHRCTTPPGEMGPPLPRLVWIYSETDKEFEVQFWRSTTVEMVSKDEWSQQAT